MIHKLKTEYENLQLNEEIPTVRVFICFETKFKLPQEFIQLLKVVTVLDLSYIERFDEQKEIPLTFVKQKRRLN